MRHLRLQLAALSVLALAATGCGGSVDVTADVTSAASPAASEATQTGTDDAATREPEEDDHTVAEDESTAADRTVEVEMSEFAFTPEHVTVEAGETVRFVFTNTGEVAHEAVLGDMHVQQEHEAAMAESNDHHGGESGGHHGEIPSVTVEPGETGEFVHTFTDAENVMLGCHLPGHWDAGMQATLEVQG